MIWSTQHAAIARAEAFYLSNVSFLCILKEAFCVFWIISGYDWKNMKWYLEIWLKYTESLIYRKLSFDRVLTWLRIYDGTLKYMRQGYCAGESPFSISMCGTDKWVSPAVYERRRLRGRTPVFLNPYIQSIYRVWDIIRILSSYDMMTCCWCARLAYDFFQYIWY